MVEIIEREQRRRERIRYVGLVRSRCDLESPNANCFCIIVVLVAFREQAKGKSSKRFAREIDTKACD